MIRNHYDIDCPACRFRRGDECCMFEIPIPLDGCIAPIMVNAIIELVDNGRQYNEAKNDR